MMLKVAGFLLLLCAALAFAEPRQLQRNVPGNRNNAFVSPQHPYLFLSMPRGRSSGSVLHGFEVLQHENDDELSSVSNDEDTDNDYENNEQLQNDDDEDEENDDDEEIGLPERNPIALNIEAEDEAGIVADDQHDDEEETAAPIVHNIRPVLNLGNAIGTGNRRHNLQLVTKNAKPTHVMLPRENAGAIMVPDGIIEIEGQSVIDEKTGKAALLVPRAALDAIPSGSVVALMERTYDETAEERANRVVVRRRRKGSRRNVRRRGGNNKRRRPGSNNRRRNNTRKNVRVVQVGGTRRRGNRRGSRQPVVIQG